MEVAEQLLQQHRLQLVEQQQLQQRQTQHRRAAAPRPHRPVPDHPPYAEMVGVALRALGEPSGSSERSISEYIASSFTDLPPAHDKLLPYYLGKLVSSSYLCMPSPGRYLLLFEEPNPESLPPHGGRCPAVAIQAPVYARGASPTPRRRGRPPKNRAAVDVPAEQRPSPARPARGRPRKNPLSSPLRGAVQKRKLVVRPRAKHSNRSSVGPAATDMDPWQPRRARGRPRKNPQSSPLRGAVQKRKLIVRPRAKHSNRSYVGAAATDMDPEMGFGRPQNQPSMDVSCVSNASISLDYEADEESLLLDPIHGFLEEDLVWGLPMQPEPEAKLLLPSTAVAAGQLAMPMAELFGDKAALPLDSAIAPANPTVEHCDPVQPPETSMGTEAVQFKKDEQVVLHHGQAQISVTMQSTVEENKMEFQEVFN